eukprot:Tamp_01215.p1 GENE.Tamp_01215~~Tamp_01215.p1  ORF type:complete len:920 (+),score=130.54 Tamp_01215:2552-5311(+)
MRIWMHDISALVNTTSFSKPSLSPPLACNTETAGRRGSLCAGKGSQDRGSQFDMLVALTSLTIDLPSGRGGGQVVAHAARRVGTARMQEAELHGRKLNLELGTLALLVRRRHSHSLRSLDALGPGDVHLNAASSQDSDIDMCHLHATGGCFDGDDEAHGHRRLPTAPMFEFLHDCGYLGIMWMKNARASVEHLLGSAAQPCVPVFGVTDAGRGTGSGKGMVSVLVEGAHLQVAASLDSLHGVVALATEMQQAYVSEKATASAAAAAHARQSSGHCRSATAKGPAAASSQPSAGRHPSQCHPDDEWSEIRPVASNASRHASDRARRDDLVHGASGRPRSRGTTSVPGSGAGSGAMGYERSEFSGYADVLSPSLRGRVHDDEEPWESVLIGECEDEILQKAIQALRPASQSSLPQVNAGHFTRARLKARRKAAKTRWWMSSHTSVQVKGISIGCRIFAGADWHSPEHDAGSRKAVPTTQDIHDDFVDISAHSGAASGGPRLSDAHARLDAGRSALAAGAGVASDSERWMQVALHNVSVSFSEHDDVPSSADMRKAGQEAARGGIAGRDGAGGKDSGMRSSALKLKASVDDFHVCDSLFAHWQDSAAGAGAGSTPPQVPASQESEFARLVHVIRPPHAANVQAASKRGRVRGSRRDEEGEKAIRVTALMLYPSQVHQLDPAPPGRHALGQERAGRRGTEESFGVALAPLQVNLHEVTATLLVQLMNRWSALNDTSGLRSDALLDEEFELLNLDSPRGRGKAPGDNRNAAARVVVRPTFLKLNLKRKWEGELESMQSERYFQIAHEALIANIIMYYLETVPAFALPSLAKSFDTQVDWHQVSETYSHACVRAMLKQSLAHVLNPFKVKQVLRNLYAVTTALSRILADRSKLVGMQRGLIHALRAMQHAANRAIRQATSHGPHA